MASRGSGRAWWSAMFWQRVVPGLVLGSALWIVAGADPWVYVLVLPLFATWGAGELFHLLLRAGHHPAWLLGMLAAALLAVSPALPEGSVFHVLVPLSFIALAWTAFRHGRDDGLLDWFSTLTPALYVGGLLAYFLLLRGLPHGDYWVRLVFLCTWSADVAAFFVGRRWGRHKLAPILSPNKSWEGGLAGFLAATLVGALLALLWPVTGQAAWSLGLLGLLIGVVGLAGDLCESFIKRQLGAKDSSRLLFGHGGILDRLDSLLAAGMVAYYYLALLGR